MKKLNMHEGSEEQVPVTRPQNLRPHHRNISDNHRNSTLRRLLLIPTVLIFGFLAALYRGGKESPNMQSDRKETVNKTTNSSASTHNSTNNEEAIKKKIRNNIRAYVTTATNAYQHGNLGGISDLKISVSNTSDYTLDKIRVKIVYIKANGNIWDTRFEDFTSIKPNTTITHAIPDTKRGTRIEHEIATIKSKTLGL